MMDLPSYDGGVGYVERNHGFLDRYVKDDLGSFGWRGSSVK